MRKELHLHIRVNGRGQKGFSLIQKCYYTIRQLAFIMGPDSSNEDLRMLERTTRECVYNFARVVIILYRGRYLRNPTICDTYQLYTIHENTHGFSGILGNLYSMHWGG
uniref:Uncharacterized protein n=1 Tax=Lactuca sativa TaxID=4236 RepID=A0A9R1WKV6_LACSA|nr:hypothetical protein LSAT_V11C100033810 [Lactuca sativa]